MSTNRLISLVFFSFLILIFVCLYFFRSSLLPQNTPTSNIVALGGEKASTKEDMSVDRVKTLENEIINLKKSQEEHDDLVGDLSEKISILSTASAQVKHQKILASAYTQGGQFSTSSTVYTPMGMYTNVACKQKCVLWINFYTSSKNLDTPNSSAGYVNTYGIFLNDQDKSIYTQGSFPAANSTVPISLNAAIPVNPGTHTIDIRAKTTAGTLRSDVSFLQIIAIEQ